MSRMLGRLEPLRIRYCPWTAFSQEILSWRSLDFPKVRGQEERAEEGAPVSRATALCTVQLATPLSVPFNRCSFWLWLWDWLNTVGKWRSTEAQVVLPFLGVYLLWPGLARISPGSPSTWCRSDPCLGCGRSADSPGAVTSVWLVVVILEEALSQCEFGLCKPSLGTERSGQPHCRDRHCFAQSFP